MWPIWPECLEKLNICSVLGFNLKTPTVFFICWWTFFTKIVFIIISKNASISPIVIKLAVESPDIGLIYWRRSIQWEHSHSLCEASQVLCYSYTLINFSCWKAAAGRKGCHRRSHQVVAPSRTWAHGRKKRKPKRSRPSWRYASCQSVV